MSLAGTPDLRVLIDSTPGLIHTSLPDGYLDFFNESWLKYVGRSLEDLQGWKWTAAVHPDDVEGIVEKWRASLVSGEPFLHEARVRRADGEYRWMLHHKIAIRDEHGNIVKWYGSSIDIEDRKRAEDKIRAQEAELRQILDLTPHHLFVFGADGRPLFANQDAVSYFGVGLDRLLAESRIEFVHPDDRERFLAERNKGLLKGVPYESEARLLKHDGTFRWFLFRRNPFKDQNGHITRWYGTATDIEDRKRAEEELRRNEYYLAEGQRLAHTGSWVFGPAGFDHWSPELFRIYGLDPATNAPTVQEYLDRIHPQDREFMANLIKRILADASRFDVTKRIVRPDGKVRYIRCVGAPVVENQRLKNFVGTAIDVTEHELLAQELRRREAYLAEAQGLSHTGSFGWKPDSGEIVWSDETYRIFEFDKGVKLTIDSLVQRVHPEDRADFLKVIESASAGATQFEHTYRLLLPDGSVKHVHALAHALQDASGNREFVGAATDVTSIKRAEEELRKSEAYLAEAQRLSHTGSWAWSLDTDVRYWSEECYRVLGFDPKDGSPRIEELIQRIHPDDQPAFRESAKRAKHSKIDEEVDYRIVHPGGAVRDIHSIGHPVFSPCGDLIEYTGTVIDITERKRAEEELRRSEAYLAEAQRLTKTGSWAWSPDQDIRYWSEECYRVLSFDPQDGLPRFEEFFQRIHPDDQPGFRELIQTAIREKAEWEADYRIVHPDGPVRDIHVLGHPVLDTSGHLIEFVGTVIDVTERKRAEEELRRSEMELRQMLDLAPQHIAVFRPNRERLYANRVALDYLGLSLEEWRQTSGGFFGPGRFIHPDDSERVKAWWDRALASGSAYEGELRLRKHDGSYRWFLARYNPVRDEHGQITRWYVAATDIDERKRAEERLQQENVALREEIDKASMFEEIVGASPALKAMLSRVSKVAASDSTVLITGETGTGKELIARAIHRRSRRSSRAFVSVNCAAIPRDLIASELFGHEKGSFTGATQQRLGRFELAAGGTIFLDEVGELPAETQIALLRVLQEHEFERVGGSRSIQTDVRVIAATNRDLQAAIATGTFRSDLFYRLNVFPVEVPPLRERTEDIPLLVEYFIDRYARQSGKTILRIDKKTLDLLQSYPWPGNIRELQNVIERSVIVCETETFSIDPSWLSQQPRTAEPTIQLDLSRKLAAQEKEMIEAALRESRGRVFGPSGAAAKLGMARSTLESKIRALRINKNRFKTADS
jgi:PAS domain S-box-containing protein